VPCDERVEGATAGPQGAELVHPEDPAVLSHLLLVERGRAARAEADRQGDDGHRGRLSTGSADATTRSRTPLLRVPDSEARQLSEICLLAKPIDGS
jgi:hypothetical protein